jgi:hypothetical protein
MSSISNMENQIKLILDVLPEAAITAKTTNYNATHFRIKVRYEYIAADLHSATKIHSEYVGEWPYVESLFLKGPPYVSEIEYQVRRSELDVFIKLMRRRKSRKEEGLAIV